MSMRFYFPPDVMLMELVGLFFFSAHARPPDLNRLMCRLMLFTVVVYYFCDVSELCHTKKRGEKQFGTQNV